MIGFIIGAVLFALLQINWTLSLFLKTTAIVILAYVSWKMLIMSGMYYILRRSWKKS